MGKLVILDGENKGKIYNLRSRNIIGRHLDCSFIIKDNSVSGNHCKIDQVGQREFVITDLNSSNGTFVNNKAVKSETIRFGDLITLGNIRILFQPLKIKENESTVMLDLGDYTSSLDKSTHCGRPTAKEWKYCPYCGLKFSQE